VSGANVQLDTYQHFSFPVVFLTSTHSSFAFIQSMLQVDSCWPRCLQCLGRFLHERIEIFRRAAWGFDCCKPHSCRSTCPDATSSADMHFTDRSCHFLVCCDGLDDKLVREVTLVNHFDSTATFIVLVDPHGAVLLPVDPHLCAKSNAALVSNHLEPFKESASGETTQNSRRQCFFERVCQNPALKCCWFASAVTCPSRHIHPICTFISLLGRPNTLGFPTTPVPRPCTAGCKLGATSCCL